MKRNEMLKKFSASCSIWALLIVGQTPLAYAQDDEPESYRPNERFGELLQVGQGLTQQLQQQYQQQAQMQQMQQMISSLAPQPAQSKFFPQCQIPATIAAKPSGFCEMPGADPMSQNMINEIIQIGTNYENYYDHMLTPAQNSQFPRGIRCLQDAKTNALSEMQDRQNFLQNEINKIAEQEAIFKDRTDSFLKQMDDLNSELNGGQTNSNENKSLSFKEEFSPECQAIIGPQNLTSQRARQAGLNGLVEVLQPKQSEANDYRSKENNIKNAYDKIISKLSADLSSKGMNDILDEMSSGSYTGPGDQRFFSIESSIVRKSNIINAKKERVEAELKESLGNDFQIPDLNRTFVQDFNRFIQNADNFYKKKFVGECVTGGNNGLSMNIDQLLRSLEQRSTNNRGRAHINYRIKLAGILEKDAFIEDKMREIRSLDKEFNNEVTITFRDQRSREDTKTPYELLQMIVADCRKNFDDDKTYSTQGPQVAGAGSTKREVDRAKNLMEELRDQVQDFQTGLITEIDQKFNNCDLDSSANIDNQSCTEEGIYSPGAENSNFCFKKASVCSRRVQACDQRAKELVQERKDKLKVAAAQFNQEVDRVVALQKQTLENIKNRVIADSEFLKRFFPGAEYTFPEELIVKAPELSLKNGEMLRGGGEVDFQDLIQGVKKLQLALQEQSSNLDKVLTDHINEQQQQIAENKRKWADIKSSCERTAQRLTGEQSMQAQAQMNEYQEQQQKLGLFCQKFESLAATQNPAAGCDGPYSAESLYSDAVDVAAHLDKRVKGAVGDYTALCLQVQNEQEHGTEEIDDDTSLADACAAPGRGLSAKMADGVIKEVPSALSKYDDEIKDFLLGATDELPDEVKNETDIYDYLTERRAFISPKSKLSSSKSDFERQLESVAEDKREAIVETLEAQIGNEEDIFCSHKVYAAAAEALVGDETTLRDFKVDMAKNIEDFSSTYKTARSIASTDQETSAYDEKWRAIGERINGRCMASQNTGRNNHWLGENYGQDLVGEEALRNLFR